MAIHRRPEYALCRLNGSAWDVPGIGRAILREPCAEEYVQQADARWPASREPKAENAHWSWSTIAQRAPEQFALVRDGEVLALWASMKGRPLSLQVGLSYRLDFLEVTPTRRGQSLGLFCLGLVAQRALEAGCSALVLEALPGAKEFYIKAGGLQARAHGWNLPQGLIPFLFQHEKLTYLKELTDAYLDQS